MIDREFGQLLNELMTDGEAAEFIKGDDALRRSIAIEAVDRHWTGVRNKIHDPILWTAAVRRISHDFLLGLRTTQ